MITNTKNCGGVAGRAAGVGMRLSTIGLALCLVALSDGSGFAARPPAHLSVPVGTELLASASGIGGRRIVEIRAPRGGATLGVILFADAGDIIEPTHRFGGPR